MKPNTLSSVATRQSQPRQRQRRGQHGVSLIVSLVLLVVVTLLALGSMRGVVMQARMSGTTHDRNLSFQAAEAALREGERRAVVTLSTALPAGGCVAGLCATPPLADAPRWLDAAFAGWTAAVVQAPADAPPPETIVEDMGTGPQWLGCDQKSTPLPNCLTPRYRVTSRSTADGRASVTVQSQVAAP